MDFFNQAKKPEGRGGRIMVHLMNLGHKKLYEWGLSQLEMRGDENCLDVGCGGGGVIAALLAMTTGRVDGVDVSEVSVSQAKKRNPQSVDEGRTYIGETSVEDLPFEDEAYHIISAFETIYFWPDLPENFREILRVLIPGGTFLIANEVQKDTEAGRRWEEEIEGMRLYGAEELKELLEEAGFCDVAIATSKRGLLAITAKKPTPL